MTWKAQDFYLNHEALEIFYLFWGEFLTRVYTWLTQSAWYTLLLSQLSSALIVNATAHFRLLRGCAFQSAFHVWPTGAKLCQTWTNGKFTVALLPIFSLDSGLSELYCFCPKSRKVLAFPHGASLYSCFWPSFALRPCFEHIFSHSSLRTGLALQVGCLLKLHVFVLHFHMETTSPF